MIGQFWLENKSSDEMWKAQRQIPASFIGVSYTSMYTVDAKYLLNYPPYIHLKTQDQSTSKNTSAPNIDRQKRERTTSSWNKVLYTALS